MDRCRFDVNMVIRAMKLAALMATEVVDDNATEQGIAEQTADEIYRAEYIADEIFSYCDYLENVVLASMPLPNNRAVFNTPLQQLSDNR